jgi:molecular chaperone DnaK (HSP70)
MARDENSRLCFGWEAKQSSTGRFDAVKRMFATQLDFAVDDAGDALAVEEVATMLFAELRRRTILAGLPADQAVITVPANSKGRARHRTKLCAGMAGLEVLALINEPTAAAMSFAQRHPEARQLLVFDWGGGTLDVTVLQSVDGVFIEQASSGLPRSGGLDFDSRLEKIVRDAIPGLENLSPAQRHALRIEVELAKVRLSTADATTIQLPDGKPFRITRNRFEQEIEGLLNESRIPLERCLNDLQIGQFRIAFIFCIKIIAVAVYVITTVVAGVGLIVVVQKFFVKRVVCRDWIRYRMVMLMMRSISRLVRCLGAIRVVVLMIVNIQMIR